MMGEDKRTLVAGFYDGEIVDYGIKLAKKEGGDPQAFIKFRIKKGDGEGHAELTWFGGLSNKIGSNAKRSPMSYTVSTLLDCGFKGNDTDDLAMGPANEVLAIGNLMSLTVEDNDYDGKTTSRIKYVNPLGSSGIKRATPDELNGKIDSSAFRAMLLQQKENKPSEDGGPGF